MAGNFPNGSLSVAFAPDVAAAIQDRTLQRVFRDSLFPRLLFRMESIPELWPTNLGTNQTFTRTGTIKPRTRPISQQVELTPKTYQIEQWEATAQQWADTIDTHMPTNYVTLASQYLRNMHQLGLHSGQSLNRVVRDKMYNAYVAGNTVLTVAGAAIDTVITVANCNGFAKKLKDGRPAAVSASNPLPITIDPSGTNLSRNVIGVTPDDPANEAGPGTLTLSVALGVIVANRASVLAVNRSELVYSGGGDSVDAITAADQFALSDVRSMVSKLRFNNVPTHEDGYYHLHLDPISVNQIFGDNEFQRLNQSLPDGVHYRKFAIGGPFLNTVFYSNTECPFENTVDLDPVTGNTHGFELVNAAGIKLHRPIVSGLGTVEEKYLDESQYISDAGTQGRIGEFAVTNNGVQVMTERIRLILRAPQDRLQQNTATSWSFSGDWPIPSDETGAGSKATFKRAVVSVHGE